MSNKIVQLETDFMTLDRKELEKRFQKCSDLSRLVAEVNCGLDMAEAALSTNGGAKRAQVRKGVKQAAIAAEKIKTSFWIPDDRTAYAVEKGARNIEERLSKGAADTLDPKEAKRILASVKGTSSKVGEMVDRRKEDTCGISRYESVFVKRLV